MKAIRSATWFRTMWGKHATAARSLRTDRASGIITCAFGIVMICFASFGLMVAMLQRTLITTMTSPAQPPDGNAAIIGMQVIHNIFFVYLPIMLLGGVIYGISGFYLYRGSHPARRVAQANAICGYLWVIAYSYSCYRVMHLIGPTADVLPQGAMTAFRWLSLIHGTLTAALIPTALLYVLSRPQFNSQSVRTVATQDDESPS